MRVVSGGDTRKYQARPVAEVILLTAEQFTPTKRHCLCAESFVLLGCPTSTAISTRVHLSNSLPSLHSLPLYSLSPVSLSILLLCRSEIGYSQVANVSPGLGPESQGSAAEPRMAEREPAGLPLLSLFSF